MNTNSINNLSSRIAFAAMASEETLEVATSNLELNENSSDYFPMYDLSRLNLETEDLSQLLHNYRSIHASVLENQSNAEPITKPKRKRTMQGGFKTYQILRTTLIKLLTTDIHVLQTAIRTSREPNVCLRAYYEGNWELVPYPSNPIFQASAGALIPKDNEDWLSILAKRCDLWILSLIVCGVNGHITQPESQILYSMISDMPRISAVVTKFFEVVEMTSGVYGDNGSLMYHHGYGYDGPYSPAASPVSSMGNGGLIELHWGPRAKGFTPVPTNATEDPDQDQNNKADSTGKYTESKFFVMKSYSEDDIHKSIKYEVWASTPYGNKKLDAAYREGLKKPGGCPIFLFFSVNRSGQFVGLAEMVGPVDFQKNLEYWSQDKWNGCFPVKWYIVKDVPNSLLKHIILENNENKPVTDSRDTQEVKLEPGHKMLKIFMEHSSETCILDDYAFYEIRQEKKAKQMQQFKKQIWEEMPTDVEYAREETVF